MVSSYSLIVYFHKNFNTIVMCNEKRKYTLWTKMVPNKVTQAYVNEEKVGWITPQRNFTTFYLLKYDVCWFTMIFLCLKNDPMPMNKFSNKSWFFCLEGYLTRARQRAGFFRGDNLKIRVSGRVPSCAPGSGTRRKPG